MYTVLTMLVVGLGFSDFQVQVRELPFEKPAEYVVEVKQLPTAILQGSVKDSRPEVLVGTKAGCPPCKVWKGVAETWKECPVKWKEFTTTDSTPSFHWKDSKGQWYKLEGWAGKEQFLSAYQNSFKTKTVVRQSSSYNPRWTYPAPLSHHLQSVHGINTQGMSQDDMERAHDNAHEGRRGR